MLPGRTDHSSPKHTREDPQRRREQSFAATRQATSEVGLTVRRDRLLTTPRRHQPQSVRELVQALGSLGLVSAQIGQGNETVDPMLLGQGEQSRFDGKQSASSSSIDAQPAHFSDPLRRASLEFEDTTELERHPRAAIIDDLGEANGDHTQTRATATSDQVLRRLQRIVVADHEPTLGSEARGESETLTEVPVAHGLHGAQILDTLDTTHV